MQSPLLISEMGRLGLVNENTFLIALKTLAACRELNKCVQFFHLMNGFGVGYNVKRLNLGGLKLLMYLLYLME